MSVVSTEAAEAVGTEGEGERGWRARKVVRTKGIWEEEEAGAAPGVDTVGADCGRVVWEGLGRRERALVVVMKEEVVEVEETRCCCCCCCCCCLAPPKKVVVEAAGSGMVTLGLLMTSWMRGEGDGMNSCSSVTLALSKKSAGSATRGAVMAGGGAVRAVVGAWVVVVGALEPVRI